MLVVLVLVFLVMLVVLVFVFLVMLVFMFAFVLVFVFLVMLVFMFAFVLVLVFLIMLVMLVFVFLVMLVLVFLVMLVVLVLVFLVMLVVLVLVSMLVFVAVSVVMDMARHAIIRRETADGQADEPAAADEGQASRHIFRFNAAVLQEPRPDFPLFRDQFGKPGDGVIVRVARHAIDVNGERTRAQVHAAGAGHAIGHGLIAH